MERLKRIGEIVATVTILLGAAGWLSVTFSPWMPVLHAEYDTLEVRVDAIDLERYIEIYGIYKKQAAMEKQQTGEISSYTKAQLSKIKNMLIKLGYDPEKD